MEHTIKQIFLKERLVELFHKLTIDSYRVRIHNTNSLLCELKNLLMNWEQRKIKQFETVKLCAEELIDSLQKDNFIDLDNYNKDCFLDDLRLITKSDEKNFKASHYIFVLEKLIIKNESSYVGKLFEELEKIIFSTDEITEADFIPTLENIDSLISTLGTELINLGHSKSYIYSHVSRMYEKREDLFRSEFSKFKDDFSVNSYADFSVIFKFDFYKKASSVSHIVEFCNEVAAEYIVERLQKKYPKFLQPDENSKFIIFNETALDNYSAMKQSKAKLSELLDRIHVGTNSLEIMIPPTALIINKSDKERGKINKTNYFTDGNFESDTSLFMKYDNLIANIKTNINIKNDVKDRINSALRYLRLGSNAIEIEQRFINYWIALEFLFSSPETEQNTYSRLKENMINILSCCYVKRNAYFLNQTLIKDSYINSDELFWTFDEDGINAIRDSIVKSPLLKYRFQKTSSKILGHSDKRKDYIKSHEKNLNQNISRIYHLRNELIHEAAIKQDIENITSNLRYYLVFLLNQIIVYFSNVPSTEINRYKDYSLDDMFSEYRILKKHIEYKWDKEVILSVPVETDLINKA